MKWYALYPLVGLLVFFAPAIWAELAGLVRAVFHEEQSRGQEGPDEAWTPEARQRALEIVNGER